MSFCAILAFGRKPVGGSAHPAICGKCRRGLLAEIVVTIDFDSLMGLRDRPGEMHGIGPVPAQAVRDMIQREGTTIRRVVYDPIEGVLLDLGKRYPVDGLCVSCSTSATSRAGFPDARATRSGAMASIAKRHPRATRRARIAG